MSRARPDASTAPGRTVRCAGGYAAFVPDPLPTELAWTPTLVRALSDADRLIGRLAGEGGRLPNPHLLIRPFIRREAVLSSRIEGTRATLGELLAAEAGAAGGGGPAGLCGGGNYGGGLGYRGEGVKTPPPSLRATRAAPPQPMAGGCGGHAAPRGLPQPP